MYIKHMPEKVTVKGYKYDDCTVIAIGNALGISYDLSRKILQTVGVLVDGKLTFRKQAPRRKDEFTLENRVNAICSSLCKSKKKFPRDSKENRVKLKEFAEKNKKGLYIALVDGHLAVVVNGEIVDTWDSGERKIICSYKIDVSEAHSKISNLSKFYKMNNKRHIFAKTNKCVIETLTHCNSIDVLSA